MNTNMIFPTAITYAWLSQYLWSLLRIAALMSVTPVFSSHFIAMRIRISLIVILTIVIAPTIVAVPSLSSLSLAKVFILVGQQVLIGLAMGFILQLVIQAFVIAGQLIAMQSGLGFAVLVAPNNGIPAPLISQFYLLLFVLIFLAINGHFMVIQMLADSFQKWPIAPVNISPDALLQLIQFAAWMFKTALLVSLPCVISLLLVNLALGVLARATPQLNIFAIGFPVTLILGIMLIYLTLNSFLPHVELMIEKGIHFAANWLDV